MNKLAGLVVLITFAGCDSDRVAKLEKQTADLERQVTQLHQSGQLELQAKCAKDAKAWFNENWNSRDPSTLLLNYTNHYNASKNKCFISIEYHFSGVTSDRAWYNSVSLHDVYENSKYGEINERHTLDDIKVSDCQVYSKKCSSMQEYQSLTAQFLNN